MKFGVVSLFPEWVEQASRLGVLGRAQDNQLFDVRCFNPRDWATDNHRSVDDRPFGGGPGMLMKHSTTQQALKAAREALPQAKVIYLSPQGERLNQALVEDLARLPELILLAGRYEGVDERLVDAEVDLEISLGDFVLTGGELGAAVVIDAVARQIPGVLGDQASAVQDSFAGHWLDSPHFTKPVEVDGNTVPAVLRGGNHKLINDWRSQQAIQRSWERRVDLFERKALSTDEQSKLDEHLRTLEKARHNKDGNDDEKSDY